MAAAALPANNNAPGSVFNQMRWDWLCTIVTFPQPGSTLVVPTPVASAGRMPIRDTGVHRAFAHRPRAVEGGGSPAKVTR